VALSSEELIERAWDALDDEEYDEAEALGRRALMIDPDSVDARVGVARALINKEDYAAARRLLAEAAVLAPDDAEIRTDLGIALFESCEFAEAATHLDKGLELGADSPDAYYWSGLSIERRGDYATADLRFAEAHSLDPQAYPMPVRLSRRECLAAVEEARLRLPREFDKCLENVAIRVEDLPSEAILTEFDPPMDPCLLGLFVGIPLTDKSSMDVLPRLSDTVFIFQRNLERSCDDHETLVDEIFTTLYHEIGHYIGYDEDDLAERDFA
jgi:predicted Zn-dependent protease with MMP-like domain